MAFSEIEIKRIEKAIDGFMAKRRPPAHIRNEVDFDHRINGQSIELFEVRAYYQDPEQKVEIPFAKVTYVKTQKLWKLFWHKSDMKALLKNEWVIVYICPPHSPPVELTRRHPWKTFFRQLSASLIPGILSP